MKTIEIYKFRRADGGITVATEKPKRGYIKGIRYIADKGKLLVHGDETRKSVDEFGQRAWAEIDAPKDSEKEEEMNEET